MTAFYRVMLGRQSIYAKECFEDGFIQHGLGVQEDLSKTLGEHWRPFNVAYAPISWNRIQVSPA